MYFRFGIILHVRAALKGDSLYLKKNKQTGPCVDIFGRVNE